LYLEGQKYLYGGHGVRQNCALARQNLLAAANNDNSKAESTLGTMYATGHCVPRDIPLAYRWFARALHADPRNTRLEKDAEIMWNQMTPPERQLALRNQ
jgi:TPR repeat protein